MYIWYIKCIVLFFSHFGPDVWKLPGQPDLSCQTRTGWGSLSPLSTSSFLTSCFNMYLGFALIRCDKTCWHGKNCYVGKGFISSLYFYYLVLGIEPRIWRKFFYLRIPQGRSQRAPHRALGTHQCPVGGQGSLCWGYCKGTERQGKQP